MVSFAFSHHSKDDVWKQLLHLETKGSGPSYTSTDISCPPNGEMPETLEQSKNELHEAYVYILLLLCMWHVWVCMYWCEHGGQRQLCTAAPVLLPSFGFSATKLVTRPVQHTPLPTKPPDGTKLNSLAHPSQFSEKQHADSISADGSVTNRKALMKTCEQNSDTFHNRPSFPGKGQPDEPSAPIWSVWETFSQECSKLIRVKKKVCC